MTLHSPMDFADIVDNYVDGWRKTGWMPECRSNNLPGWTQGGEETDSTTRVEADHPKFQVPMATTSSLISPSIIITKLPS